MIYLPRLTSTIHPRTNCSAIRHLDDLLVRAKECHLPVDRSIACPNLDHLPVRANGYFGARPEIRQANIYLLTTAIRSLGELNIRSDLLLIVFI